jgi:hypothetical protein
VAVGGLLLTAIALAVTAAFSRAPLPPSLVRDPVAARELVALMRAEERGRWIVRFDYTRTLANGRTSRLRVTEGRSSSWHVIVSGSTMTIERGDRSYQCDVIDARAGCQREPTARALPASEVVRVAVATGAYDVVEQPAETIAGLEARCFRVRATGQGSLPFLGAETDRCFADDGIPLRAFVARPPGTVDEQVAVSVESRVSTSEVKALARSFARDAERGGGSVGP